jgi:hypothetical protein
VKTFWRGKLREKSVKARRPGVSGAKEEADEVIEGCFVPVTSG